MRLTPDLYKTIFKEVKDSKNLNNNLSKLNLLLKNYGDSTDLLILKGILLSQMNLNKESESIFEGLFALNNKNINILYNYSLILKKLKKYDYSIDILNKILILNPKNLSALNELGVAYVQKNYLDKALITFKEILKLDKRSFNAMTNISNIFFLKDDLINSELYAQKSYKIYPNNFVVHYNLANVYQKKFDYKKAIKHYQEAINLNKNFLKAYNNLSGVYQLNHQKDKAISILKKYLEIKDDPKIQIKIIYLSTSICNWENYDKYSNILNNIDSKNEGIFPFRTLALQDSPLMQKVRSKKWSKQFKSIYPKTYIHSTERKKKIRLGYFSSDFHGHATMHLISGIFRKHNHDDFEILIYNYSKKENPKWKSFIENYSDKIFNLNSLGNDYEIIDLVRKHNLDIAIDLKGYTYDSKVSLFKDRLAKIQLSFLGYPGTLGSDFIDYIIADETVIPKKHRHHYTEKILYMPHTYQPNDDFRDNSNINTTRSEHNLPDQGTIFCCFNDLYKISPIEFDVWMRILNQTNDTYLWLLASESLAIENLKKEALKRNINPNRLIFAKRVKNEYHLERHKHADLFLDCFNYNAHTTASDALRGGLPLVTLEGDQFSSRVASSLLKAIGMDELITYSKKNYEDLILRLTHDKEYLSYLRKKILENKKKFPLFNTQLYTNNYEKLLKKSLDCYYSKNIQDIYVNN